MAKISLFVFFILLVLVSCSDGSHRCNPNIDKVYLAYGGIPKNVNLDTINCDSIKGAYLLLSMEKYDFGRIKKKKAQNITIEFEMENIGKKPMVIIKSDVSCGCLSVDFPKEPILAGHKAKLRVMIDLKNQGGLFNKSVFIKSNAENDVVLLRILGEVQK